LIGQKHEEKFDIDKEGILRFNVRICMYDFRRCT